VPRECEELDRARAQLAQRARAGANLAIRENIDLDPAVGLGLDLFRGLLGAHSSSPQEPLANRPGLLLVHQHRRVSDSGKFDQLHGRFEDPHALGRLLEEDVRLLTA
jgi:hypothetical protein